MKEEISKWIRQADHDLKIAKEVYKVEGYDTCAFLCQQAVEKYIKALYIFQKSKNPPRTHYLDELGKELDCPANILDLMKDLSSDYMISRYPDITNGAPFEDYSSSDAKDKIADAEKIIDWVKERLK